MPSALAPATSSAVRTLVFVAPWECSEAVARVPAAPSPRVVLCFVESLAMGARLPWHRQKLVLVLSAMRHFAERLRDAGHVVDYRRAADWATGVAEAACAHGVRRVVATRARDRFVGAEWTRLRDALDVSGIALELREDRGFLDTPERFADWARGRRELRLEWFYRDMRRRHGVLLDEAGAPAGGAWNFDAENRKPWPKGRALPPVWREEPDDVTRRTMARVARWDWCWGDVDGFALPVTRDAALAWLERFAVERLPEFGPYEDAMQTGAPDLLHSTLAPLLNVGLLHPLEVVRRAERAWREGAAPLPSVEGFVRQVVGWREYVRGMYWWLGPDYEDSNALGAERALPRAFWGWAPAGDPLARMACLTDSVRLVHDHGRVHHIPRLMVQANLATLLGVRPRDLNRWFWAAFVDGAHWVTTPNVVGMATWGDGGKLASKPYVATGAYVQRMSDHCRGCAYDPARRHGEGACPMTVLYWDFLARHRERFAAHPRMGMMVRNLDRLSEEEVAAIRADAAALRDAVAWEAPAEPMPVAADALVTTWNVPARGPEDAAGGEAATTATRRTRARRAAP